jgi:hypothetical protein
LPSLMRSSAFRLEQTPARAIIFCTLSNMVL